MTRLEKFLRAAASGYAVLLSNIVYTLLSLRMAVHALPREEFGIWATAVQVGLFLGLVDFGLTTAVSRHLIDHKDERDSGGYGRMLKATLAVLLGQAMVVFLIGLGLVAGSGTLLGIPEHHQHVFAVLLMGQVALMAFGFPVKFVGQLLIVHQRYDALNVAQVVQMGVQLVTLWLAFNASAGVYALLWAAFAGFIASVALVCYLGLRREFLPKPGCWGKIDWTEFRGVFAFGQSAFFVSLGMQLLTATQTILVTKVLGLGAAAEWNIFTRSAVLVFSLVCRSFDVAFPALSEMVARGEVGLFAQRVNQLLRAVLALTVVGSVGIAAANQAFVELWVGAREGWGLANDWLLGLSLVPLTLSRCLIVVLFSLKDVSRVPLVLLAEGVAFVSVGGFLTAQFGFPGLLAASLVCSAVFSTRYAVLEVARRQGLSVGGALLLWVGPPAAILVVLGALSGLILLLTADASGWEAFAFRGGAVSIVGLLLVWKLALEASTRAQVAHILRNYLPWTRTSV